MVSPRKFLAWVFAVAIALAVCLGFALAVFDLYHGAFPRLAALTTVSDPLGQAFLIAGTAAVPSTVLVILLTSTRGELEFSVLGMKFRGPSGPLLLWVSVFLAVSAVILTALAATDRRTVSLSSAVRNENLMPFNTGWIFVGYHDQNGAGFREGPFAKVVYRPSSGVRGPVIPELGDVLQVGKPRQVIIANYRRTGTESQFVSPPLIHGVLTADDETGVELKSGKLVIVRDVEASNYPGRPFSIWVRVAECDPNTDACVKAAAELQFR